jgi:transcriptional regulator with XRE-family HTH domain
MIHRALKLLRIYHNFKQKDLAEKLDLSPSHLSEIEAGAKPVSYELLEKYSKIFGIPVSTIALFAEASGSKKKIQSVISDKALRLLEWLDTITQVHSEDKKHNPLSH